MTLQEKLNAMNTRKTSIGVSSSTWAGLEGMGWQCRVQYENTARESFAITSADYLTIEEAVNEVYEKFMAITGRAFEDARPAQLTFTTTSDNTFN